MASVFKFQTSFCHDFLAQRRISSRANRFASARESRVVWLCKKIFCITVLIKETLKGKGSAKYAEK